MSVASEFVVDFLLVPSVPSSRRRIQEGETNSTPCVERVDSLNNRAGEFEKRLNRSAVQISRVTSEADLASGVKGPIRVVCHETRDLTERILSRAVLEKWKPEVKSVRPIAVRVAKLFGDAVELMGKAREKLLQFNDRDSARLVERYVESACARIALLQDIANANADGVRAAVERLCLEIEKSGPGFSTAVLTAYLRLGEKFVSAAPDLAFLPLSGKYRVFAAMSLVQNLTAWVSELGHEAGPFLEAIPAHMRFAESIYDTAACIVARADDGSTIDLETDAGQFEKSLKLEIDLQLEKLFQTYELIRQQGSMRFRDPEREAGRFLGRVITDRAHGHLADAVQIFRNLFQDQVEESERARGASRNARVIVFKDRRYEEPELQWAAHGLEFNLVAYGESPQSALKSLRDLVTTDLEFRAECGLEPQRGVVDGEMEQKYLATSDRGKHVTSEEWKFPDRSIQLQVCTQPNSSF